MKGLQTGIPLAVLAAVAKAHYIGGETAIDGNHGTDVGNSGSMSFDQAHNTGVHNKGHDDHSITENWKGTVKPGIGWPLRRKARHWPGGETAIDGAHNTDVGNGYSSSNDQSHNTGVSNHNKDDHSATFNGKFGTGWPLRRDYPSETAIDGNHGTDVGNSISKTGEKPSWAKWADEDNDGETAIDGVHNTDVGGSASFSNDQEHNTGVKNKHDDDHSATFNGKGWFRKRQDETAIDAPHGTDVGDSASSSNDQTVNTKIVNKYEDNHSVTKNWKEKEHHHTRPCTRCHPKRQDKTAIDAPHGTDVGNSQESKNDQAVNTEIVNEYKDDHSVTKNWKEKEHHHTRPCTRCHPKRQDKTAIDAPHGTDVGNSQESNNDQAVNTEIENKHKDDHSVTKNWKKEGCHHCHAKRQGLTAIDGNHGTDVGNGFSSSNDQAHNTGIDNDYKDDHSYTGNTKAEVRPWWFKRHYPETGIDGAHNTDVGNSAGLGGDQAVNTAIENDSKDDHSVTANGKFGFGPFFKRSGPLKGIDGAHNVDVGNDFGSSNDQEHNTAISNEGKDDHSFTANTKAQLGAFPFPFAKRQSRTGIDGAHNVDVGNDASFSYDQDMNTGILNDFKDDHSKTSNAKGQIGTPFLPFAKRADNDRWPEVPHAPVDVAIDAPHGTDIGNQAESSSKQAVNTEVDNKDKDDHSATLNGKVQGDIFKRAYRPGSNEESVDSSSEVPEPEEAWGPEPEEAWGPEPEAEPSHAVNTPDAACATETRQLVHTVTQTVYTEPSSAPAVSSPADPTSSAVASPSSEVVQHLIMTSTLMVPASSSFHQIPVYVPEPSPMSSSAVASNSHVPAGTPASSSASVPTSVDAYRPGAATSEAIPSPSHGAVSFQGAGVQLAPSAGIMSAVAGVMALLAFVL